jgi:hypothetical protein
VVEVHRGGKKKGTRGGSPKWLGERLLGSLVARIGRQHDESAVDGERFQFDGKARTFLMREGGADPGPFLLGLPLLSYSSTVKTLR